MADRSSRAVTVQMPDAYNDELQLIVSALGRGEQAAWEVARRLYELCGPPGKVPRSSELRSVTLERVAEDIARDWGKPFSTKTASLYRRAWADFGLPAGKPTVTFHEAMD